MLQLPFPQCAHPYGFSPVCDRKWPCSSHGRENSLPQTPQLCDNLCVSTCIANAGIETYAFPHVIHFLADCESKLRCVCLCRDKLLDVAYCLPHSVHVYFDFILSIELRTSVDAKPSGFDFRLERPSLTKNASYVYATVRELATSPCSSMLSFV